MPPGLPESVTRAASLWAPAPLRWLVFPDSFLHQICLPVNHILTPLFALSLGAQTLEQERWSDISERLGNMEKAIRKMTESERMGNMEKTIRKLAEGGASNDATVRLLTEIRGKVSVMQMQNRELLLSDVRKRSVPDGASKPSAAPKKKKACVQEERKVRLLGRGKEDGHIARASTNKRSFVPEKQKQVTDYDSDETHMSDEEDDSLPGSVAIGKKRACIPEKQKVRLHAREREGRWEHCGQALTKKLHSGKIKSRWQTMTVRRPACQMRKTLRCLNLRMIRISKTPTES